MAATEPCATAHRHDATRRERVRRHSAELCDHLSATSRPGADLKTLADGIGPLLVKIMHADRGFIRLFADSGADEHLGITGLETGATIPIMERAFMKRLLAGRHVLDGATLLAPIICRSRTIGFFCLNRHRAPKAFTDDDGHFLIGVGQALAALTLRTRA
jgi:hypothetical protein